MQDNGLVCWKCGASIGDEPLPLSRLAECRSCRAQLHACRMCEFHDTRVAKACRETVADEVKEKDRANFCGYFQPRKQAHVAGTKLTDHKAALDALFGDSSAPTQAGNPLDDLFKKS